MFKTEALKLIKPSLTKLKVLQKRLSNDGIQELIKSFEKEPERLVSILQTERENDTLKLRELEITMNNDISNDINHSWEKIEKDLASLIIDTCKEIDNYANKYHITIEVTKENLKKALNSIDIKMLAAETASTYPVFSILLDYITKTSRIKPENNWCYLISVYDMAQIGITKQNEKILFKEVFQNDREIKEFSEGSGSRDWQGYKLTPPIW